MFLAQKTFYSEVSFEEKLQLAEKVKGWKLGQTYKYIGFPWPDRVYRKRAGQNIFLMCIPEKKFFSHKYIINKD